MRFYVAVLALACLAACAAPKEPNKPAPQLPERCQGDPFAGSVKWCRETGPSEAPAGIRARVL